MDMDGICSRVLDLIQAFWNCVVGGVGTRSGTCCRDATPRTRRMKMGTECDQGWDVWKVFWALILVQFCFSTAQITSFSNACDITIESQNGGNKSGTFASPNWPNRYGNNMRCIYRFVGLRGEKVQINFTEFEVKGVHQRCQDDYVDVYTEIRDAYQNLLDVPLHGRYCGDNRDKVPHLFISMYSVMIIGFYTDLDGTNRGFNGTYKFIDASIYTIGTTVAPNACGQKIHSHSLSEGTLLSPTYPGVYPDNIICSYKLIGIPGQRVRFTFNDLDMYSGGEHCPYDYIKIYDGYTNEAEVIGTYCGQLEDLKNLYMPPVVFSTGEALLIEFVTNSGRVEPTTPSYVPYYTMAKHPIKQTGFNATFEFSDHFVKLDFIKEGEHIRGTECDQRVCSGKETNGSITTPNFPGHYPPNITCKFYIDGLDDKENLEKTKLKFDTFDVPSTGDNCQSAYVKAYIHGQDIRERKNADFQLCGNTIPDTLVTEDPRLLLVFQAGPQSGMGFKGNYHFVTDYDIDGTPSPDPALCHFFYNSRSAKSGTFKSPRNPSHYLPNTECTYDFVGLPGEQVRITFENFKLQENDDNCTHDYVTLYMVTEDKERQDKLILVGHYCEDHIPGPMVTDEDIMRARVVFHSDESNVRDGFKARYEFIEEKPYGAKKDNTECLEPIKNMPGAILESINYPKKYTKNTTCEYLIRTRPKTKILMQFIDTFDIEGQYDKEKKTFKCANAVLKVYLTPKQGRPNYEICSKDISTVPMILSQENFIRIKFIRSARATGGNGFRISWSEVMPMVGEKCDGFLCATNGYCISKSLYCNDQPNCGVDDFSDEPKTCDSTYTDHGVLHIILGVVISLIVLVFIIVCILHRHRKARKKKNKKEIEVRYVTRGGTPNRGGPATDKLLKERTEKVSIV